MTRKEVNFWAGIGVVIAALLILIICIGTGRSLWLSAPLFTVALMFLVSSVTDETMRQRFEFWKLRRWAKRMLHSFKQSQHSRRGFIVCRNRLQDIFIEQAAVIGIDEETAHRAFYTLLKELKGRGRASW